MWAGMMSRWVTVYRHNAVGRAGAALRRGRIGPTAERAMARAPSGAWQRMGQQRLRGGYPPHPRATRGEECMLRHNGYSKSHLFLLAIHTL
jgi:hypothetical protein